MGLPLRRSADQLGLSHGKPAPSAGRETMEASFGFELRSNYRDRIIIWSPALLLFICFLTGVQDIAGNDSAICGDAVDECLRLCG